MAPRKTLSIVVPVGIIVMFLGVIGGALLYREMRAQRVLHEESHLLKFDPSSPTRWMTAPLTLYQDGPHAIMLALSGHGRDSAEFHGVIVVVVADPSGATMMNVKVTSFGAGIPKPANIWWFPLDTLVVKKITSSEWKISARLLSGDPHFAGSLGELVVIPPGGGEFTPYLETNAYKLYFAGFLIMLGFVAVIFGGRKSGRGTET